MKNKKKVLNFAYPKKEDASLISEFEIMNPTQEGEVIGEKLGFNKLGTYSPSNSLREYKLLFLLDHTSHYRISMVVMNGIQYVIPADREKNWLPKMHPDTYNFFAQ